MQSDYFVLKKGNMSVDEYEKELNRVVKFASEAIQTDEEALTQRFLVGLDPQLQREVIACELTRYFALVNKTKLLEQKHNQIKEKAGYHDKKDRKQTTSLVSRVLRQLLGSQNAGKYWAINKSSSTWK